MQTFQLIPFPSNVLPNIHINGLVERVENELSIRYVVQGEIENLLLPTASASPARKHDVWKATCFEFFLAILDQQRYWEFNLSPSRDWNVYAMDAYRQVNMREEIAFTQLPFEFRKTNEALLLDISVDLSPIVRPAKDIQLGVTAIIQTKDVIETYWALAHSGPYADFHVRESFVIEL